MCVYRDKCSYVYKYICLYCVSQTKKHVTADTALNFVISDHYVRYIILNLARQNK
jgi:hypothetical protein